MSTVESASEPLALEAENIGGITGTTVDLPPGLTVLVGQNATNRTSLLQALMASMGSDEFTLKGDADAGRVALEFDDTVVERRFERRNDHVEATGEGYLDDPELAELFAFLLEENEARRAVARGENLRELITRPIDTDEIEAEIERLQATKREVEDHLSRIDDRERELVDLESRKQRLETEVEEQRAHLEEFEAEIEAADTDLEAERETKAAVEEQLDALKDRRSRLENIRFNLETLTETIQTLEEERAEKQAEREALTVDPDVDPESLRSRLDDLRERQRRVNAQMNELQSIVQFNEDMLEGTDTEIGEVLRAAGDADERSESGAPTDKLLADDSSVTCWTCGSDVDRSEIEATLDRLRAFRQEKIQEGQSIQDEIDELNDRVSSYERAKRELDELDDRLAAIDVQLETKRERIESLEADQADLHAEIEELETAVEAEQSSDYDEILELHKEANKAELELEQAESELASVRSEIDDAESRIAERDEYEDRHDQITAELETLRTRIDRLESNAVDAFNGHIEDVLDLMEFENIARIWIERQERETRDGRRKVSKSFFDLHIVREAETGEAYEGTVENLSESEREVVGLVFALAGYLVHDLHETVPVMVLDSLEAIDADRIARLLEYFVEYTDYLVVALLPEDASAIEDEHTRITDI